MLIDRGRCLHAAVCAAQLLQSSLSQRSFRLFLFGNAHM
jgi:hypothetical protein